MTDENPQTQRLSTVPKVNMLLAAATSKLHGTSRVTFEMDDAHQRAAGPHSYLIGARLLHKHILLLDTAAYRWMSS